MTAEQQKHFEEWKAKYFSEPKQETIFRSKRTSEIFTDKQLLKRFKKAMCIK